MTPFVIFESENGRIVIMDSISPITDKNEGDIIVCGSHGGKSAAGHAVKFKPKGIIFNDAGKGKEDAGIGGLEILEKEGIIGVTVDAFSARIGDGKDSYDSGIVSAVNERARQAGIKIGMSARDAALRMLTETEKLQ
jgi:hypothetical protein